MPDSTSKTPLLVGLPARLSADRDGFQRLCSLLGLQNREQRRAILNTAMVKPVVRHLKGKLAGRQGAERERVLITAFYEQPVPRRILWEKALERSRETATKRYLSVPSLEYRALEGYDAEFRDRVVETENLEEALLAFPDIVGRISEVPESQRPALAVWLDLHRDVDQWETLSAGRRDAVVLALFSVATILNDVRPLRWAIDRVGDLAAEFAFVPGTSNTEESALPQRSDDDHVMAKWKEICGAVSKIADTMGGDPPQPGRLPDLLQQTVALEELHGSLVTVLERDDHQNLLSSVAEKMAALAAEYCESPLKQCAEQMHAQWWSVYRVYGRQDVAPLRADIERFEHELKRALEDWRTAWTEKAHLDEQLQELKRQSGTVRDPRDQISAEDREVELHEEIAAAAREVRDARDRMFVVAAPAGETFDPAKDYARDDDGAPSPDRPAGEDVQEPAVRTAPGSAEGGGASAGPASEAEGPYGDSDAATSTDRRAEELDRAAHEDGEEVVTLEPVTPATPAPTMPAPVNPTVPVPALPSADGSGSRPAAASSDSGDEPVPRDMSAQTALWRALENGRPGIAYHIARLQAEQGAAGPVPLAALIRASMLARHARSDDSRVVGALRKLLENISPDELLRGALQDDQRDAVNLLLFSATLRPTLFAPSTGAPSLLRRVSVSSEELTPVYELAKTLADHADRLRGVRLDSSSFRSTSRGEWQKELDSFVARVGEWRTRAESKRNLFARANLVWRHLLSDEGCIGQLAALVLRDDGAGRRRVEDICKQLSEQKAFNELVWRTDRKDRRGDQIEGRALKQLWHDVQPAVEFSAEWLRLMDIKPNSNVKQRMEPELNPSAYVNQRIDALRKDLARYGSEAIKAMKNVLASETSVILAAALKQAGTAVGELLQVLDGETEGRQSVEQPKVIESRDLVYVTGLDLDTSYSPVRFGDDAAGRLALLLDAGAHADTPRAAFDARIARGDLIGALLACNLLEAAGDPDSDQCRESMVQKTEGRRRELRSALAAQERRLEHAFCRGQIDAGERSDMAAELVSIRTVERAVQSTPPSLDEVGAVAGAFPRLDEIGRRIETSSEERMKQARSRLQALPAGRVDSDARSTVDKAMDAGDLLTANEQIARLEEGESVQPPPVTDDPFREFESVVQEIERACGVTDVAGPTVVRRARGRECVGGVSFENLTDEEAEHAASLLEAWHGLARKKSVEKKTLQNLLHCLGFKVRSISTDRFDRGRPGVNATVETEVIEDRSLCPSRQFGSEAAGRYRILLNWERPAEDSIPRSIGGDGLVPTLVLHFGCLGADREKLRARAVQMQRLFVVVDESLILFLAARPSGRLSAMFRCSLPYTSVDPYATTSGVVPPELFYGRERERKAVMDQSGACFIYGGRQLGKTALLRRVERDFNRSHATHVAKWIDLKVNEIGYARGPSDIWPLLQRELVRLGVIDKRRRELDPEDRKQVEAFLNRIRQWLDEREGRRLLLLLDEADEFLNQDARTDFKESARLKGLMDETDRRFKVVFAGLHNVMRTTQQANHPLAHFGDPIRVGAMLSNGEWRQAQALVREPLRAVGCRFEHDDLSTRILAQTNYYPSLIQLYGAALVRRLRDSTKPFPYEIDDGNIDDAFASRDLGSAIRERFLLTLQLDERYAVIAYALAFELHERDLGRGVDRGALLELAREWWPKGFELQDVEFNMLLHEMEGLGVLRVVEQDGYTLRNPNVLLLLGNSEDIEKALSKDRKSPTVYEPKSFRARYPGDVESSARRGPLTYLQESELRKGGVAVISGCNAAGLQSADEFLSQRIGGELFERLPRFADVHEFERCLREQRPARNGVTVYLVPLEVDWDASWVLTAKRILKSKARGRTMWSRVAFIATPSRLWRLMNDSGRSDLQDVDWIGMGPCDETFLRRWLQDINLTADVDHAGDLVEVSGGWLTVLDPFRKRASRSWQTRIDNTKRDILNGAATRIREWFGLSGEAERVLRGLIRADDPFDRESIALVAGDIDLDVAELQRRVEWSERLGLLSRSGEGCWTFNPLLKRLLEAGDPAQ